MLNVFLLFLAGLWPVQCFVSNTGAQNIHAFAALKDDGSVVAWGNLNYGGSTAGVTGLSSGVVSIYSNNYAFAALKDDGSVVAWGNAYYGGSTSGIAGLSSGVVSIYSNSYAFAALKDDGSVVVWGESVSAGSIAGVNGLSNVTSITSTEAAFAALKNDGTVVAWGRSNYGGSTTGVTGLSNVTSIYSTRYAFAALKNDGSVVAWGDSNGGGSTSGVTGLSGGVQTIYSNSFVFAALKYDGSVVAWGYNSYGGGLGGLTNVVSIYSNDLAFAALKSDGSVFSWGYLPYGGASSGVAGLSNVKRIYATASAFAALRNDGTIVAWGDSNSGGNVSGVTGLSNVTDIYSTSYAFAALKNDGSAVAWGNADYGGNTSRITGISDGVVSIYSTNLAFVALKNDGSVLAWGEQGYGGNTSGVTGLSNIRRIYGQQITRSIPCIKSTTNCQQYSFVCFDQSSLSCTRCSSSHYVSQSNECIACSSCPSGQYIMKPCSGSTNTVCSICTGEIVPNCATYGTECFQKTNSKVCLTCMDGYYLSTASNTCKPKLLKSVVWADAFTSSISGGSSTANALAVVKSVSQEPFGLIITGTFSGNLRVSPNITLTNSPSASIAENVYIVRLDLAGEAIWAINFPSTAHASGTSIGVDNQGNSYVAGIFSGNIRIGSVANLTTGWGGNNDVFVAKLDADGHALWARAFPSTIDGAGIAVNAETGGSYVCGYFEGTLSFGNSSVSSQTHRGFLLHLDAYGNGPWVIDFQASYSYAYAVTLDSHGRHVYVTGSFGGSMSMGDLYVQVPDNAFTSTFICKLDAATGQALMLKHFSVEDDRSYTHFMLGFGIAVDSTSGNVYATGRFKGTTLTNPSISSISDTFDGFVLGLNATGDLFFAKAFGGPTQENGIYGVSLDTTWGIVTITGTFQNALMTDGGNKTLIVSTSSGVNEAFIVHLDALTGYVLEANGFGALNPTNAATGNSLSTLTAVGGSLVMAGDFTGNLSLATITSKVVNLAGAPDGKGSSLILALPGPGCPNSTINCAAYSLECVGVSSTMACVQCSPNFYLDSLNNLCIAQPTTTNPTQVPSAVPSQQPQTVSPSLAPSMAPSGPSPSNPAPTIAPSIAPSSTSTADAFFWTEQTGAGNRAWTSIAASTDGMVFLAGVSPGFLYRSIDGGVSWMQANASYGAWRSIASSSNATKLVAVEYPGYIYTSIDSGISWTLRANAGSRGWISVASSSDGSQVVALVYNGYIYTSADSGVTWTEQINAGSRAWRDVASSANGTVLAATVELGYVYVSRDSGMTWMQLSSAGTRQWGPIACSSDGQKLVAAVHGEKVYVSEDLGVSWTERSSAGNRPWQSLICIGSPCAQIVAAVYNGYIYHSRDFGLTWIEQTEAGSRSWSKVASSSNGTKLVAVATYGFIYTTTQTLLTPTMSPTRMPTRAPTTAPSIGRVSPYFNWTSHPSAESRAWNRIVSSSNGSCLLASVTNGNLFTSTDGGLTWIPQANAGMLEWQAIAMSNDFSRLVAVVRNGGLYISKDQGLTWDLKQNAGSRYWYDVASSDTGDKLVGAVYDGYLYRSADFGESWTEMTSAGSRFYRSVACSTDCQTMVAGAELSFILISTDMGVSWTEQINSGNRSWKSVAISSDGSKMVAAVDGWMREGPSYIYLSSDSGINWLQVTSTGAMYWSSVAISSDASIIVAAPVGNYLYVSTNGGQDWAPQITAGARYWWDVTSSTDGRKLASVVDNQYIYTAVPVIEVPTFVPTFRPTSAPTLITMPPSPAPSMTLSPTPTSIPSPVPCGGSNDTVCSTCSSCAATKYLTPGCKQGGATYQDVQICASDTIEFNLGGQFVMNATGGHMALGPEELTVVGFSTLMGGMSTPATIFQTGNSNVAGLHIAGYSNLNGPVIANSGIIVDGAPLSAKFGLECFGNLDVVEGNISVKSLHASGTLTLGTANGAFITTPGPAAGPISIGSAGDSRDLKVTGGLEISSGATKFKVAGINSGLTFGVPPKEDGCGTNQQGMLAVDADGKLYVCNPAANPKWVSS